MRDHSSYLTFDSLTATGLVSHGFSTRLGGVSSGAMGSLNLGRNRGDDPANVAENYRRICRSLGLAESRLVTAKQIHSTRVLRVEAPFAETVEADGFITNVPGLVLVTFHADCVPLYFVDPAHRAVGLAHAGWRGTVDGMARAVIRSMNEAFGTKPEELLVGIGPSIGPCSFQVGPEVADAFASWSFGKDYIKRDTAPEKYKIDLWGFNRALCMDCGVPPERIEVAGICTMCRPEQFFSHRLQGENRGSMAAFLALNSEG